MPIDFAERGRTMMDSIVAPGIPLDALKRRSRTARVHETLRAGITAAVFGLGAVGIVSAAMMMGGIHIWFSGNRASWSITSLRTISDPTAQQLAAVVRSAAFPVVLPVGLPVGVRITRVAISPIDRPTSITIEYRKGSEHLVGFTLFDSATIGNHALPSASQRTPFAPVRRWSVGRETVVVPAKYVSSALARSVEAAMKRSTPGLSLQQNIAWSSPFVVLGGFFSVEDRASRIAPAGSNAVLVDRGHAREIPQLAKAGRPLLDSRTIDLNDIPAVNGYPQYNHAKYRWPKAIAIAPQGVRAVARAMRASGCATTCEYLYAQTGANSASIWAIPVRGGTIQKYLEPLGAAR